MEEIWIDGATYEATEITFSHRHIKSTITYSFFSKKSKN